MVVTYIYCQIMISWLSKLFYFILERSLWNNAHAAKKIKIREKQVIMSTWCIWKDPKILPQEGNWIGFCFCAAIWFMLDLSQAEVLYIRPLVGHRDTKLIAICPNFFCLYNGVDIKKMPNLQSSILLTKRNPPTKHCSLHIWLSERNNLYSRESKNISDG